MTLGGLPVFSRRIVSRLALPNTGFIYSIPQKARKIKLFDC